MAGWKPFQESGPYTSPPYMWIFDSAAGSHDVVKIKNFNIWLKFWNNKNILDWLKKEFVKDFLSDRLELTSHETIFSLHKCHWGKNIIFS